MKRFENKIALLRTPVIGVTMSRTSTIAPSTGCPIAVTINEHQWEVVVETFSCFVCYLQLPPTGVR